MNTTENKKAAAPASADAAAVGGGVPLSLSADTVAQDMQRLMDDGEITAGDKALLLWLFGEAKRRGLSLADVGRLIGYDASTVSKLFRGRYEGNLDNVIASVRRYKHLQDERGKMVRADFVETSVWRKVRDTCDLALVHQMPGIVMGVSQIGKTESLKEYMRRSEYNVRYVRIPAAPGFRGVIEAVADACNVTTRCTTEHLRRRIAKALDPHSLLIVDEFHQLAISAGIHSGLKCAEWLREVCDVSGCGVVYCGTFAVEHDLLNGAVKGWMEQIRERAIKYTRLPSRLPDDDIRLVAQAYEMPEVGDDILPLLRELRMNRLVKTLSLASHLARKRQKPVDWQLFRTAHNTINN
jgi:DNA transposition AAA+ family ATPase